MKESMLKVRLQNVLQAQSFCCACLDSDPMMYSFEYSLVLSDSDTNTTTTIGYVVESLFGDQASQLLLSSSICESCKNAAITSYTFIQNTKRSAKVFENLACQLKGRLEELEKMIESSNEFSNTIIVLNSPFGNIHTKHGSPLINDTYMKQNDDNISPPYSSVKTECQKETKDYKYKCDYCNKSFAAKQGMACHMLKVHSKRAQASKKDTKERIIVKRSVRKNECPDCIDEHCEHMKYVESYITQKDSGSKQIKCPDCEYVCYTKTVLISHVNKVHLKCFKFKCKYCDKLLYSKLAYKRHLSSFHTVHQSCEYCEKKFAFTKNLAKHLELCRLVTRPYKCDECKVSLDNRDKLIHHQKKHMSLFPCSLCNKVLSSEGYLNYHMANHKNGRFKTYNYRCLLCKANFTNATERDAHVKEHGPDEKPVCHKCNEQFDTIQDCRQHLPNCKFNKRQCSQHKCQYCDFATTSAYNLEGHINRYHLKVAPYKCGKCDKRFTTRAKLCEHAKTHEDIKTHMCGVCNRQFRGPTALKKHIRLHTGEKPYLCEICGEDFISSTMKSLHVVKKHSAKTIQCPLCDMKFFTLPLMRSHFKQVHWKLKGEQFDVKKVEGLKEEHYDLFRDRRLLTLK